MNSRLATFLGLVFLVIASALPASRASADQIFWANSNNTISVANTDGTGGKDIGTTGATAILPIGLALDPAAGRIYWANFGGGFGGAPISSASLDGGAGANLQVGAATAFAPNGVAIDPSTKTIYWANFTGLFAPDSIASAKLAPDKAEGEGSDLSIEGATIEHPSGVAIDPGAKLIYWTNEGTGGEHEGISVANLATGKGEDLKIEGANHEGPRGLAVDPAAGRVYWTNFVGNKISFAKLDGSGGGDLPIPAADVEKPFGIAVDHAAGRIYWVNHGEGEEATGSLFSAKLDGSDAHRIAVQGGTVSNPNTPVLLAAPRSAAAPAVSGGSAIGSTLSCTQGTWAPDIPVSFLYEAPQKFVFQWTLGGKDVAGANASTMTATAAGAYACRVTATNHAGSTVATSASHQVSAAPTRTAPTLTKVALKPRRFSKSTVLRFLAGAPGVLTVKVAKGRKVKATIARKVKAGAGKVRLRTRIGKRKLAPGRYTLTATLRDAAGDVSKPVRLGFTIFKP